MTESGLGMPSGMPTTISINPLTGNKSVKMGALEFPPRKVWIKTFGCQMNYHDTERLLGNLAQLNFEKTDSKEEADLILFNSCAIRDLSNLKFYSHLGEIKNLKKNRSDLKVGVGGCVAQTEARDLLKKYKHLDFAFGTDVLDCIGDMVYRLYSGERKFKVTAWDRSENFSIETKITHGSPQAFVNIIKGCDKYCTYCIVPYTRGKERSRKIFEIVEDVSKLVKHQNIQEITLLGQNVNSFGKENGENLANLLYELDKINGLKLIRYTTSHPKDVTKDLIIAHRDVKKLSKHLHLPVQSGSNSILKQMLREYTIEEYMGLITQFRETNPDMVFSTDIIVGFPNETENEYQETLDLLKNAQFDSIFSYIYSPRKGTKAEKMDDSVSLNEKGERLRNLQKFQLSIQEKIRQEMLGKTFQILVEGESNMKGIKKWKGRTNCNRIVHFLPPDASHPQYNENFHWKWVDVRIDSTTSLSCMGTLI
jgi:tRNA-2-methylthio-N6-dimethylallyladenosine synthase